MERCLYTPDTISVRTVNIITTLTIVLTHSLLLTSNAVVYNVDKAKACIFATITQIMCRWIVEYVLTDAAAAFSVTYRDVWVISWRRTSWRWRGTLIGEPDFSRLNVNDLIAAWTRLDFERLRLTLKSIQKTNAWHSMQIDNILTLALYITVSK